MAIHSESSLALSLSKFGMAEPQNLDAVELLLYRFENMLERRPEDQLLGSLVAQLRDRVNALGMQDLLAGLQTIH